MATFTYEALTVSGEPTKGSVEAANRNEAIERIKSMRFFPTRLTLKNDSENHDGAKRVDTDEDYFDPLTGV